MPTNYPTALDTTTNLPAAGGVGVNLSTFPHSALHGNVDDAVIAIETELGVNPSGTSATVASRFSTVLPLTGGLLTGDLSVVGTILATQVNASGASITGGITSSGPSTFNGTLVVPTPTTFTQAANGIIRGSGSPETVVSATVGMKYIDTAATTGAIEWIKASGAASTGWKVVYGDTGIRNIAASISAGFTTTGLNIRRVRERVTITWNALKSVDGDPLNEDIYVIPSGFQAASTDYSVVGSLGNIFRSSNVTAGYWAMATTPTGLRATLVNGATTSTTALYTGGISYVTDQAWPTTLPGT